MWDKSLRERGSTKSAGRVLTPARGAEEGEEEEE
jgi:hypothetical protein